MADATPFQDHLQSMAALGRPFKVGDIYDYRRDETLTGSHIWGKEKPSQSVTRTRFKNDVRLLSSQHSNFVFNNKFELMGLDKHLQVSVMAGVIDKFHGASQYVNDSSSPALTTQTLVCRAKLKEEILDLQSLASLKKPIEELEADATHVVVGVFYGAEFYCVLIHDLEEILLSKFTTEWKNSLEESQDLLEFKQKFGNEEKLKLNQIKCKIYSDLQPEAVREWNIFEAYKQCLILIDSVQNSSQGFNLTIPIAVMLCPLKVIMDSKKTLAAEYYDLDSSLVSRYYRVCDSLERTRSKADALRTDVKVDHRPRLRRFVDAIVKYQEILKENVTEAVIEARKTNDMEELEKIVDIAETHNYFRPSRVKRWLYNEKAELEMMDKLVIGAEGITFVPDVDYGNFDPKSFGGDKKFAFLMFVPSLNEMKNSFLSWMEAWVEEKNLMADAELDEDDNDQDGDTTEEEEENDGIAFHNVEFMRKLVESNVRELTDHLKRNKGIENQVAFFVTNDRDQETNFYKFLYEYIKDEEKPKKTPNFQLPKPPTNLRIRPEAVEPRKRSKPSMESIRIKWDQSNDKLEDYPYHFFVEYRLKGSSEYWARKKTSESFAIIEINPGEVMECRVAAGSFIGLSEFSPVVYSNSVFDVEVEEIETAQTSKPPTSERRNSSQPSAAKKTGQVLRPPTSIRFGFFTPKTAEITWIPSSSNAPLIFSHCIRYCLRDEPSQTKIEYFGSSENRCKLLDLHPGTSYVLDMFTTSRDRKTSSVFSKKYLLTTLAENVRFAQMLITRCSKVEDPTDNLYAVPFCKQENADGEKIERYVFGRSYETEPKTVLIFGASGSGKTELINGIFNYVFNVEWEDPFRFQFHRIQTECVNVYEINHYEGFNIDYSLTIIDTPGYGEDANKNKEITKMLRQYFEENDGEKKLDLIGFVMQSSMPRPTATEKYIVDSLVSIFGEEIKENIVFLLTFADKKEDPPLLSNITDLSFIKDDKIISLCKFDNSSFFCVNEIAVETELNKSRQCDLHAQLAYKKFLWFTNQKNLCLFFKFVNLASNEPLSSIKKLLKEKNQIKSIVTGLELQINIGLMKMGELETIKQAITDQGELMESNIEFQVNVIVKQKLRMPLGQFPTNCTKCNITCHKTCGSVKEKAFCDVMDHSKPVNVRPCLVCPGNCMWNVHATEPFKWEHVQQQETTSVPEIKKKYEEKVKRTLTTGDLFTELEKETKATERAVLDRFEAVVKFKNKLNEIDNSDSTWTTIQLINQWMIDEKKNQSSGYETRIKSCKKIRLEYVINSLNTVGFHSEN